MKTKSYSLIAGSLVALFSMCAAPSFAGAGSPESFGGVDPDAYATKFRQELAKEAIANSTSNAEKAADTKARASKDCTDMKKSAAEATRQHVENHMPPDPTKVIEKTTCYISVDKTKIPSTGFGFADSLIDSLMSMSDNGCVLNQNSWNAISSAVKSGDIKGLAKNAILQAGNSAQQSPLSTPTYTNTQAIQGTSNTAASTAEQPGQTQSPAQKLWGSMLNAF